MELQVQQGLCAPLPRGEVLAVPRRLTTEEVLFLVLQEWSNTNGHGQHNWIQYQ